MISRATVERMCKNWQYIKVLKGHSIKSEYTATRNEKLVSLLSDLDSNLTYYVLLRAIDLFRETHLRYPGVHVNEVDGDIPLLKQCVALLCKNIGVSNSCIPDDQIHEMLILLM